jgi:NAD(P)H dehydrogenase (quinone)
MGIESLMFVSTTMFGNIMEQRLNVLEVAGKAGIGHIAYTAIQRRPGSNFDILQVTEMDAQTERALSGMGCRVTILRNPLYLDSLPFMFWNDVLDVGLKASRAQRPPLSRRVGLLPRRVLSS